MMVLKIILLENIGIYCILMCRIKKIRMNLPRMGILNFHGIGYTPQGKGRVKREIESTDKAIDKLVYDLYGLTDEEIKIVESK